MKLEIQLLIDGKPYLLDTRNMTIAICRKDYATPFVTVGENSPNEKHDIAFWLSERETETKGNTCFNTEAQSRRGTEEAKI